MRPCNLCGQQNPISKGNLARYDYRCKICLNAKAAVHYAKKVRKKKKVDKDLLATYQRASKDTGIAMRDLMLHDIKMFFEEWALE